MVSAQKFRKKSNMQCIRGHRRSEVKKFLNRLNHKEFLEFWNSPTGGYGFSFHWVFVFFYRPLSTRLTQSRSFNFRKFWRGRANFFRSPNWRNHLFRKDATTEQGNYRKTYDYLSHFLSQSRIFYPKSHHYFRLSSSSINIP